MITGKDLPLCLAVCAEQGGDTIFFPAQTGGGFKLKMNLFLIAAVTAVLVVKMAQKGFSTAILH